MKGRNLLRCFALISAIVIAAVSLFACSSEESPEATVSRLFEGIKQYDTSAFEKELYFADENERDLYFFGLDDEQYELYRRLKDKSEGFSLFLAYAASDVKYDITGSETDGDHAEVRVSVNYIDGSDFVETAFARLFSGIIADKLNGTDKSYSDKLESIIYSMTYGEDHEFIEVDIEIELIFSDGCWKAVPNDDIEKVMTSRLFEHKNEIKDILDGYLLK